MTSVKFTKLFAAVLAGAILCFSFIGCAPPAKTPSTDSDSSMQGTAKQDESTEPDKAFPKAYMVETENRFDYQPGFECSAFASAYILRHYGEEADGLKLFEDFPGKLPDIGVMYHGITKFFNDRGYDAKFVQNGTPDILKEMLSKGAPVIVFIHVAEPYESVHNTHYVPIVGYDEEYFYFAESLEDYANCKDETDVSYNRKTKIEKFELLWKNIDGAFENPYFQIEKK